MVKKFYNFAKLKNKVMARRLNIQFFRSKTGLKSIPKGQYYLTLCGLQTEDPTSEINQLVKTGFIKKEQYYGIDRDKETIKRNRKAHPEAKWFHGEWEVFLCTKKIYPAMIYLDTTHFVGADKIIKLTKFTMNYCPSGTFLFVNVMLNNPHHHSKFVYDKEEFVKKLGISMTETKHNNWKYFKNRCVLYQATLLTKMATYTFRRTA